MQLHMYDALMQVRGCVLEVLNFFDYVFSLSWSGGMSLEPVGVGRLYIFL